MDIYQRYGPALMRKCIRMLGSVQDAEDIVQGLFVDLLRKQKSDVDLPYLYRAVTNRSLNHVRDRHRRAALLQRESGGQDWISRVDEAPVSRDLLLKLIQVLDGKSREILVYRFFDDMTQEEISELTGYSRKTVGKKLDRIRSRAEALLRDERCIAPEGGADARR